MIIYHTAYNLDLAGLGDIPMDTPFWHYFSRAIVALFLSVTGISLMLAHGKSIRFKKFLLRLGKLVLIAAALSLVTYVLYPKRWAYFGVLHCIAVSSLLALPLLRLPKIALLLGGVLGLLYFLGCLPVFPPKLPEVAPMDYIPIVPWFCCCLAGIFLAHTPLVDAGSDRLYHVSLIKGLLFLGRHSLWVYLLHQPVLYAVCSLVAYLFVSAAP